MIVKVLLADPRVDPGAEGNQAIIQAKLENHDGIVSLLSAHPKVDTSVIADMSQYLNINC